MARMMKSAKKEFRWEIPGYPICVDYFTGTNFVP
jgi:hypothetical protein